MEYLLISKRLSGKLRNSLLPHQKEGVTLLIEKLLTYNCCLLADDMGLGKTIQTIAAMEYFVNRNSLKDNKKIIIIVPKALVTNWQQELTMWAPQLKLQLYVGKDRQLEPTGDIIITTYDVAMRDVARLRTIQVFLLVLDEAQRVRNKKTRLSVSIKKIFAEKKLVVTGTPLQNNEDDLWNLLDIMNPQIASELDSVMLRAIKNKDFNKQGNKIIGGQILDIINNYMIRRLKEKESIRTQDKDVIVKIANKELVVLPEQVIIKIPCILTSIQEMYYKRIYNRCTYVIDHDERTGKKYISSAHSAIIRDQGLGAITLLKQICNHPALVRHNAEYELPAKLSEHSGKLQALIQIITKLLPADTGIIIFSSYVKTLNLISLCLKEELQLSTMIIKGALSIKERSKIVKEFQNPEASTRILLCSLKAGGEGLNLTRANVVIHFDSWWNPQAERQANDRVYRISQNKDVSIFRLIIPNSLEESIDETVLKKKIELFESIFNTELIIITLLKKVASSLQKKINVNGNHEETTRVLHEIKEEIKRQQFKMKQNKRLNKDHG